MAINVNNEFIEVSSAVSQALQQNKPVLALESTIITHGLPRPKNLQIAMELETIAREKGVTPATIAIMNGKIKIGLSSEELEILASSEDASKASCRDIAYALQHHSIAGTTVAATLYCANLLGIKIFATGGIGGVHRGDNLDVSADLIELARTPMAVVCAGAKAILDLPRTLEFLETYGIPVIAYQTDCFPAFYSAKSDHYLQMRFDDAASIAGMLKAHWQIGMQTGVLIANPIPSESQIPHDVIEPVIVKSLVAATRQGVVGKSVTPFLLSEVLRETSGQSLEANVALVKNNVSLGAEIVLQI